MAVRTLDQAQEAVAALEAFTLRDTLRALPCWNGSRGKLPWPDFHESIKGATYVVYSYGTPIAWVNEYGKKVLPDIGYSQTTSPHQYLVAAAWKIDFSPKRGRTLRPAGGGPRRGGIDG